MKRYEKATGFNYRILTQKVHVKNLTIKIISYVYLIKEFNTI